MGIGPTTKEQDLLLAIKEGDKKAYAILFKRYYPMLCAYGCRFVNLEDAEEVVQDVMLWIWQNKEVLIVSESLSSYLFKAVYRRAVNRIVQNQSKSRADTFFYNQVRDMLQDVDYYQIKELQEQIKKAVEALPPSYREAFTMHRFEGMNYKEIAERLHVSSKTVDYRIQQALKQLRVDLKEYLPFLLPLLFLN